MQAHQYCFTNILTNDETILRPNPENASMDLKNGYRMFPSDVVAIETNQWYVFVVDNDIIPGSDVMVNVQIKGMHSHTSKQNYKI